MAEQRTPVVILGAGGFAASVYEILQARSDVLVLGCTDKALGLSERTPVEGVRLRILGDDDVLPELADQHPGLHGVLALGPELMDVRARLAQVLALEGIPQLTVVHPHAHVSRFARIEAGTAVMAGTVLGPGTHVGPHCVINLGASLDHDAHLMQNVFVGQGARVASNVEVQPNVVIEMGANINSRVVVGRGARVTGGAFVNTDVPDHAVVVGVPARVVRYVE